MPAVVAGNSQRNERMWQALKSHILRERQRKKLEQEAEEAEEERQRKERETQQKQNVMTIEETREQIAQVNKELEELRNEKHQLFIQLKRALSEDENKKRLKDISLSGQVSMNHGYAVDPSTNLPIPQLYVPHARNHSLYKVAISPSHPLLTNGPIKRSHSPSPPPTPTVSSYHPSYGYKPPISMPSYSPVPKPEDARRSGDSRVVLWNKSPNQYPSSTYYPPGQYDFGPPTSQPGRLPEPGKPVYLTATRTPLPTIQTSPYTEEKFYARPAGHVAVHGGAIPIQQPPQGAKTGGITTGYPVRAPQPPPPQGPYPPPPPGTYVSVSGGSMPGRLLYTQSTSRYVSRDV